jgi:hypothetical protein
MFRFMLSSLVLTTSILMLTLGCSDGGNTGGTGGSGGTAGEAGAAGSGGIGQTSSTLPPTLPGTMADTRHWSISRDGLLQTLLSSAKDPVTVEWLTVGTFSLPANPAGVSAVSWDEGGVRRERAFFVETDGRLRARAIDNGVGSWLPVIVDPSSIPLLAGPTSAVMLGDNERRIGAITSERPHDLLVFRSLVPSPESYDLERVCTGSPDEISPNSIVAGAASETEYCFVAQTIGGLLSTCPWNQQWVPPGIQWSGGASAVAWNDGSGAQFAVYVRGNDETIQEARWTGTCFGEPEWTSLDSPPSGVSSERYAVSAASFKVGTDRVIELAVAGNDGKLYQRRFVASTWEPWTELAAPADTMGTLGGVHVSAQGNRKTFFVGDVSAPSPENVAAGYVFEASSGRTYDHTDPVVGLVSASEGAAFPGAWTESSLAERNGKVVVGASVIRTDPDPTRVAVSYSTDDGHSWRNVLVPHQYVQTSDRYLIQGDPFAAMDSAGAGYVVLHELSIEKECSIINFFHSKIYVARTTDGTSVTVDPSDMHWQRNADPTLGVRTYLDHPTMAITSDDVQHYAWLLNCPDHQNPNCPPGSDTIYYRKRSPNNPAFDTPIAVSGKPGPFGLPYIFTDVTDHVFIAWVDNDIAGVGIPHLYLCQWDGDSCSQGVVNVTQPHGACASAIEYVKFVDDKGQPLEVRAGAMAVAASGAKPNHIFAAFQIKENTIGTPNCTASMGPLDIAFMESGDGGGTWSPPVIITNQADEVGKDQFMPSVASHDDGTVLVTYYDRSVDPTGSLVQQRVAIRHPDGTWSHRIRRRDSDVLSDLARLPKKCGDTDTQRFIGDYHLAIGGKTHAHALRVDALLLEGVSVHRLQASAFSGSAWR